MSSAQVRLKYFPPLLLTPRGYFSEPISTSRPSELSREEMRNRADGTTRFRVFHQMLLELYAPHGLGKGHMMCPSPETACSSMNRLPAGVCPKSQHPHTQARKSKGANSKRRDPETIPGEEEAEEYVDKHADSRISGSICILWSRCTFTLIHVSQPSLRVAARNPTTHSQSFRVSKAVTVTTPHRAPPTQECSDRQEWPRKLCDPHNPP